MAKDRSVPSDTSLALGNSADSGSLGNQILVPSCAAQTAPAIRGPGTPSTVSGVTTTRVNISSFTLQSRFTISGTVTSQQSGTLQKITFNPTAITAIAGSGCNTTATNPCRLEIIATSHWNDFPAAKTTTGYPAGVFLAGFFTGTEPAHASPPNANGDTVSLTGEASGLKASAGNSPTIIVDSDAINKVVINATPGTSSGDARGVATVVLHGQDHVQGHRDRHLEVVQHPGSRDSPA